MNARRLQIDLSPERSAYVDSLVKSGKFASADEVVRAGLDVLQQADMDLEAWLRSEVVPVYDEMIADPSRAVPAEQVREGLRRRHEDRLVAATRSDD